MIRLKLTKFNKGLLIFLILGSLVFFFFKSFVFTLFGQTTCGEVLELRESTYGSRVYSYEFYVDDKKYNGIVSPRNLKESVSKEDILKMNCIEIEYWKSYPSRNRVVDERILE